MDRDLLLRGGILILALLGIGTSAYLMYEHFVAPIACFTGSGCETVDDSVYSEVFGVPMSVIGLASYLGIFALQLLSLRARRPLADYCQLGVFGMALAGVVFAGYLTYLEFYVIHALCSWCLTSAALITLIWLLSMWTLREVRASAPTTDAAG
jgi:uncharacterized membrane protein